MLWDTGPLVALIDENDPHFAKCAEAVVKIPRGRMITTWPCVTEAMYLLQKAIGLRAQEDLWKLILDGQLTVTAIVEKRFPRMRELMNKYKDAPMDFADASLVVAAEKHNERRIFTLDNHFRAYLIHDRMPFEVVP